MLKVSSPILSSSRLWLWLSRVYLDFNFRLLDDNLWSHNFNFRLLDDNLWSNDGYDRNIDFDFRLLNHHLG
jgi:hypothetical protein